MKKNEFKKMMKKEKKTFKNYYVYEMILILLRNPHAVWAGTGFCD